MLLAKVISIGFVLFGLFGLLVIAIRDNRDEMFFSQGRRWSGYLAWSHAFLILAGMVACGVAVWVQPKAAPYLAWVLVALMLMGKLPTFYLGRSIKCLRCFVSGILLTSLSAIAISMGVG